MKINVPPPLRSPLTGRGRRLRTVILAAGRGTRLHPFTERRPKQMIPLAGRPLIIHLLSALIEAGVKEILVIIGRGGSSLREYLERTVGDRVRLAFKEQSSPEGTANALRYCEGFTGSDPFLAVYGDVILWSSLLRRLIDTFHQTGGIVLTAAQVEDPKYFGLIETEGPMVTRLIEKPTEIPSGTSLVNAGGYVFTPSIFNAIKNVKKSIRGEMELTDALNTLLATGATIQYVPARSHEWLHIDHPWDILTANERLLSKLEIRGGEHSYDGVAVEGPLETGGEVKIRPGTVIEGPVYIGGGAEIGPNCLLRPYTSIGERVRIGNACEVKNSIIMSNTRVSHLSYIGDSVIGENCNLGAGTITANLRFDEKTIRMNIRGDSLDTGKRKFGAVLGDNVKTGVNVSIMPGVKIGCNSNIGPNLLVEHDVPENTLLTLRQRFDQKKLC